MTAPRTLGFQRWRSLLFLHWPLAPEQLRPLVPAPLVIDTFEGQAYVGVVAFTIPEVRPVRLLPPVPTASAFHETNVRTYVTLDGAPGVWFFSLDASSTLAVVGARAGFGLPYFRATMGIESIDRGAQEAAEVHYHCRRLWPRPRPAALHVRYSPGDPVGIAAPDTLAHFLVERYTLFARHFGTLMRTDVRHQPYPLREVRVTALDESLISAAGLSRAEERTPDLYSDGVDVDILLPRRARAN
jgi:uncharacterized protein